MLNPYAGKKKVCENRITPMAARIGMKRMSFLFTDIDVVSF